MKKQVVVIHGGDTFRTYREYFNYLKNKQVDFEQLKKRGWKDSLTQDLGKDFEVIIPKMPNPGNAKYQEWKIWFEKITPFLEKEVILIGHSLGGLFLAKYLSENYFPKKIIGLFLVSTPYCGKDLKSSSGDFAFSGNLEKIRQQCGNVFVYHSSDDTTVPVTDFEKYKKDLPEAKLRLFKDRGHFKQEEFPELVEDVRALDSRSGFGRELSRTVGNDREKWRSI